MVEKLLQRLYSNPSTQGFRFILVTGYGGHKGDPPVLKRAPRVRKPVNFDELADRMTEVFVRRPAKR
jgi:hypothetical protein